MRTSLSREALWDVLSGVLDPEVPVLSVVELGIVRDVRYEGDEVVVDVTPTYSGCPAMHVIETDIMAALHDAGVERVRMRTTFTPAWTTDWMSEGAKEKLRAYGIAPPGKSLGTGALDLVPLLRRRDVVPCPYCGSSDTAVRSEFGSTACKSICYCNGCRQPFEQFKAI